MKRIHIQIDRAMHRTALFFLKCCSAFKGTALIKLDSLPDSDELSYTLHEGINRGKGFSVWLKGI